MKVADFGLAREIRSKPPYTDYVSTRWSLISSSTSLTAIGIELQRFSFAHPITTHQSINGLVGALWQNYIPSVPSFLVPRRLTKSIRSVRLWVLRQWEHGQMAWSKSFRRILWYLDRLAAQMNFRFPQFVPTPLAQIIPNASQEAIIVMQDMMKYDPQQRPTASQTLQYPYFQVIPLSLLCL